MKFIVISCILAVVSAKLVFELHVPGDSANCKVSCAPDEVKNISFTSDCTIFAGCSNGDITIHKCHGGFTFSDTSKTCVQAVEGASPTCHPCSS